MERYLKNTWYAAAFSDELSTNRPLVRTILDQRIVFFRDAANPPVALFDRCPHRFAQLHLGVLAGGVIECPYHGLKFDRSGACVHNPHGNGAIPSLARVTAYPVNEQYGMVWIWMGDGNGAHPKSIIDLSSFEGETTAINRGYMHTAANYELITDNLMDLSHADYVHKESLNTGGSMSKLRPKVGVSKGSVNENWCYETDRMQAFFSSAVRTPCGPGVQSFNMTWYPASNLILHATARDAGLPPEADHRHTSAHLLTPETEVTTHYFVLGTRTWRRDDGKLNSLITQGLMNAFVGEDKPILQAVQESMGTKEFWELKPLLLACDSGAVHARRILGRMISRERGESVAGDAAGLEIT